MPQMMPILWLILMIYTISMMIIIMSLIYFTPFLSIPMSQKIKNDIFTNMLSYKWNWKW